MKVLDTARVNHLLLHKQYLTFEVRGVMPGDIALEHVVRDIGGLHATIASTPYLSLWARIPGFTKAQLEDALYAQHTLGKIRCVRKTIYVNTRDMLPTLFSATGERVRRASRRFMEARVPPDVAATLSRQIPALLEDEEMSATAIKQALGTAHNVSAMLSFLCDQGSLVRGRPEKSWRDRRYRYARFEAFFPNLDLHALDEVTAIAKLVEYYLMAFGPAQEEDIVWWLGMGKRQVRAALAALGAQLVPVSLSGLPGEYLILEMDLARMADLSWVERPVVNMLPMLDGFIMGYKHRARYLSESFTDRVFDRSGNATNTILVGGRVVGVWDLEDGDPPLMKLCFVSPVSQDIQDEVYSKSLRLGWFIAGQRVQIKECRSMIPLTGRNAGAFMSPLRAC